MGSISVLATLKKGFQYKAFLKCSPLKSFDNLNHSMEEVLDVYFHLCSIEMSCSELARTFLFLASEGKSALTGEQIVSSQRARRINSIMQLCGFYDEAREFAFKGMKVLEEIATRVQSSIF